MTVTALSFALVMRACGTTRSYTRLSAVIDFASVWRLVISVSALIFVFKSLRFETSLVIELEREALSASLTFFIPAIFAERSLRSATRLSIAVSDLVTKLLWFNFCFAESFALKAAFLGETVADAEVFMEELETDAPVVPVCISVCAKAKLANESIIAVAATTVALVCTIFLFFIMYV